MTTSSVPRVGKLFKPIRAPSTGQDYSSNIGSERRGMVMNLLIGRAGWMQGIPQEPHPIYTLRVLLQ